MVGSPLGVHPARCLACGASVTVDFSPMKWPTCPMCGAGRTKLVKTPTPPITPENTVRVGR